MEKTTIDPPRDLCSYADSGATVHCFHSGSVFVPGSLTHCDARTVLLADKISVTSKRSGDVIIPFENSNVRLNGVLLIPDLGYNLVSTGRLADNGIESNLRRHDVQLFLEDNKFYVGCGKRDVNYGMYTLPHALISPPREKAMIMSPHDIAQLRHQRLAHINPCNLANVHKHVAGVPKLGPRQDVCRACRLGKAQKLPFPGHFDIASTIGEVVHLDIVGKLETSFPDRYRYVLTFVDSYSRYTFIGLMRYCSDLSNVFKGVSAKFREIGGAKIRPLFTGPIAKIHPDGAKEYISLQDSLEGVGKKLFSPPHTPELNGIAESVNRIMVEGALSMLIQASYRHAYGHLH